MLTCINDVGGWETEGGRTGEDSGMCGCVKSALSDTCENRPETKNTNLSKNLENVDKRAVKQVQELLEVGGFCAAKTFERVGRSERLQNISRTIYAQAQMHGKISRDGLMPLRKSTDGGSNSHRYKKVECVELQFTGDTRNS